MVNFDWCAAADWALIWPIESTNKFWALFGRRTAAHRCNRETRICEPSSRCHLDERRPVSVRRHAKSPRSTATSAGLHSRGRPPRARPPAKSPCSSTSVIYADVESFPTTYPAQTDNARAHASMQLPLVLRRRMVPTKTSW